MYIIIVSIATGSLTQTLQLDIYVISAYVLSERNGGRGGERERRRGKEEGIEGGRERVMTMDHRDMGALYLCTLNPHICLCTYQKLMFVWVYF